MKATLVTEFSGLWIHWCFAPVNFLFLLHCILHLKGKNPIKHSDVAGCSKPVPSPGNSSHAQLASVFFPPHFIPNKQLCAHA